MQAPAGPSTPKGPRRRPAVLASPIVLKKEITPPREGPSFLSPRKSVDVKPCLPPSPPTPDIVAVKRRRYSTPEPEPSSEAGPSRIPMMLAPGPPMTPKKKQKTDEGSTPETPPETPTKTVQERKRKSSWRKWCEAHQWERDMSRQQVPGELYITKSNAASFYLLKFYELDTLPYTTFTARHGSINVTGCSYLHDDVQRLVYRRCAFLSGEDETRDNGDSDLRSFLSKGKRLYLAQLESHNSKPNAKDRSQGPTLTRCPLSRDYYDPRLDPDFIRPGGSWFANVYRDGVCIGEELRRQFDPDFSDEDDPYAGIQTFFPNKNFRG